ncbi:MAG: diguanylate cyclase [Candidatus Rokubacteria bacterium]|nr:diguanylate cyclase [Candidatus Rokubacteria bacterium]
MSDQGEWARDGRNLDGQKVVEQDVFMLVFELETHKAARLQYCVSLLFIGLDAGPTDNGGDLVKNVAELAARRLRATDVVTTFRPSSIGMLLIDAETPTLPQIFSRVTEDVRRGQLRFAGKEWRLTVSGGGACYPRTATTGRDVLRQASVLMRRAREEGGNRVLIPR